MGENAISLAKRIDHALLKPDMTTGELMAGLETALEWETASVCVRGCDLAFAWPTLKSSAVALGTVIGFPHGSQSTGAKADEIQRAIAQNASEVDAVIAVGMLKSGENNYVFDEMSLLVQVAHEGGALIKFIFENCLLTPDEIVTACSLAARAGADFVKTSTGFAAWGAKVEDVTLMKANVPAGVKIKASGGIRTYSDALAMVEAGADRLGVSATDTILRQAQNES